VNPHVVIVGAGAVGGFVGGLLAEAGTNVTLVDGWPAHVEAIRAHGLTLRGTHGARHVMLRALHVCDVQTLVHRPVDIALVSVKLYDTRWASALIAPYLSRSGLIVTMQNGLVEEDVADVVGWQRVLGCVVSRFQVELMDPGIIRRINPPGGERYTTFRVGEIHGRRTQRVDEVAALLQNVDSTRVTTNLWGERWSKLVANSMTSPVAAISGLTLKQLYEQPQARRLIIRLAAEAIGLGRALGFALEPIFGTSPDDYVAADGGERSSLLRLETAMATWQATSLEGGRTGIAQDLRKGRRTEVDYLGGHVAARAAAIGLPAPTHAAITAMVHRIERSELEPAMNNIDALLGEAVA
jgi:2-dehydropantoate 2-reductase